MIVEVLATAIIAAPMGFLTCAILTAGKVGDDQSTLAEHARAADALATKQARIDRALAVETPKAAHGVRKMAAILRGDA